MGKQRKFCSYFITFAILTFAITIIFLPNVLWLFLMMFDFFTPWNLIHSDYAAQYHQYLTNQLPNIPAKYVQEIDVSEASLETIFELTDGYINPLVIRGGASNVSAVGKWSDKNFWLDNFGEEMVMCGAVDPEGKFQNQEPQMITMRRALTDPDPWYIAGEVKLFSKFPDLMKMLYAPHWDGEDHWIDGEYAFPNMFMGYPDMGSDVHTALGLNVFRMIAGRKKWWLIPSNQSPYVYGMQNKQGFSAISKTRVGHSGKKPSPWLEKIERYTVELSPGDVLINTAWFWHATHNLIETNKNELNIGVATRYKVGLHRSFRANWVQTIMAVWALRHTNSGEAFQDALLDGRETTTEQLNSKMQQETKSGLS